MTLGGEVEVPTRRKGPLHLERQLALPCRTEESRWDDYHPQVYTDSLLMP